MPDPTDRPEQTPEKLTWTAPALRELPFGATASGPAPGLEAFSLQPLS